MTFARKDVTVSQKVSVIFDFLWPTGVEFSGTYKPNALTDWQDYKLSGYYGPVFLLEASTNGIPAADNVVDVAKILGDSTNVTSLYAEGGRGTPQTTFNGSAVYSILEGDGTADSLYGGSFSDDIFGKGGDDFLSGNNGNDFLSGGGGADVAYGGAGNDGLTGDGGADTLYGDAGNDAILGGEGGDTAYGGDGVDCIDGENGADNLFGGAGADVVNGGDGNDTLNGDGGDDYMFGDAGNDKMLGGAGEDTMDGGAGNDQYTGGGGADVFVFQALDGNSFFSGNDVVNAFSASQNDQLNMKNLDDMEKVNVTKLTNASVLIEFIDLNGAGTGDDREIGQVTVKGAGIWNVASNSENWGTNEYATFAVDTGTKVYNVTEADYIIV